MIDESEDALADAYERALKLEKSGETDAAAAAYREVLALDPDDHAGAAVRLAAMGRGEVPHKAPDAYVATLFDQHAEVFDIMLVDQLGYSVPLQVRQLMIDRGLGPFERMLDLGCGTGLSGEALRDRAAHITGVDVSEGMVEVAHDKEVYDELYVAEAVRFLEGAGAAARLAKGGLLVFSTETLPAEALAGRSFMVGPKQRFAHGESYILAGLAGHGFECLLMQPIVVRFDEGEPIHGHLVLAQRA